MKILKIGLIGGTGMGKMLSKDNNVKHRAVFNMKTPYGIVSYIIFTYKTHVIVMISRHENSGEYLLPHELNWQAYMYVLGEIEKVDFVLTSSAVGAPYKSEGGLKQGNLIVPSDAIDYVQEPYTFAKKGFRDSLAFHRPTSMLFCPHIKQALEGGEHAGYTRFILANSIKGPRFETPSEMAIRIRDKVDVVGMTTVFPEAILAGELAVPYGVLCGVTNLAPAKHNGSEVAEVMRVMVPKMKIKFLQAIKWLVENEHPDDCPCRKGREESVFKILEQPSGWSDSIKDVDPGYCY